MAKQKTWKEKLLDTLLDSTKVKHREWFRIDNHKDFKNITDTVKGFIDDKYPFEFDDTYTKIRRITNFE